jgi:hypothetical protein
MAGMPSAPTMAAPLCKTCLREAMTPAGVVEVGDVVMKSSL